TNMTSVNVKSVTGMPLAKKLPSAAMAALIG
ncbi:hypothetical protein L915_21174, partial [Phytophthora nicotianae]